MASSLGEHMKNGLTKENSALAMLMNHYSDFHKDVHGFRPTLSKPWHEYTEAEAEALIGGLHAYLDAVASTPLGRQQLENEGWILNDRQPSEDGCDEHDQFRNDLEADADVLRSAGFGTDEDYGYYGEEY
jgi:hypothetical protein